MRAKMTYLSVPKPEPIPQVTAVSYEDGFLAFRATEAIPHGVSKVVLKTSKGRQTAKVDVYRYDRRSEIYDARLLAQPRPTVRSRVREGTPFEGTLEELFVGGARACSRVAPEIGSFLRLEVEIEEQEISPLRFVAEVLWVKKADNGHYNTRLLFHDSLNQKAS